MFKDEKEKKREKREMKNTQIRIEKNRMQKGWRSFQTKACAKVIK